MNAIIKATVLFSLNYVLGVYVYFVHNSVTALRQSSVTSTVKKGVRKLVSVVPI